jgi:hypothetical protein
MIAKKLPRQKEFQVALCCSCNAIAMHLQSPASIGCELGEHICYKGFAKAI